MSVVVVDSPLSSPASSPTSSKGSVTSLIKVSPGVEDFLLNDALRWNVLYLTTLVSILLLYIAAWFPGVEWIEIQWFNGVPEQGINVGVLSGDLVTTTIDSLGYNGAAYSFVDAEQADVDCFGLLSESPMCMGLQAKITAAEIYDALLATALVCITPAMLFTSWTIHQLRLGLLSSTQEEAHVGSLGCVVSNPHAWKDPCTYLFPLVLCAAAGVLVGLGTYPISGDTMAENFVELGGQWWGSSRTSNGLQFVVAMSLGYELFLSATLLLPLAIYLGCKCRDVGRELRYRGGVDVSGDKTRLSYLMGKVAAVCGACFSAADTEGEGGNRGSGGSGGSGGYLSTWWGGRGSSDSTPSSKAPTPSTAGKEKSVKRAKREKKREVVEEEEEEEEEEEDEDYELDDEEEDEEDEDETDDEQEEESDEEEEEEVEVTSHRGARGGAGNPRVNPPPQFVPPKPPPLPPSNAFQEAGAFQMSTPIAAGSRRGRGGERGGGGKEGKGGGASYPLDDFSDFTMGFGKA